MSEPSGHNPFVKVFRPAAPEDAAGLLVKLRVFLPDRPGSLAAFAGRIAAAAGNISFFHYDRSLDSRRVSAEARLAEGPALDALLASLRDERYGADGPPEDEVQITSVESVLEIKVRLENRPGTLSAFATLLSRHGANVIYMLYDEDVDEGSADIAMAVRDPAEVDRLLAAVNEAAYHYRVLYRGAGEAEASRVIGLKLVEKFYLRLKRLLPEGDVEEIKSLVASSRELEQDLIRFATEAGNDLEAGDVFETVLTFASRSRGSIGPKFSVVEMPKLVLPGGAEVLGLRLPTSENIYVLRHRDELALIDTGHGIYYEDLKAYLRKKALDPAETRRIFVTHPDTDHAGMAGYFEREFGTGVYLHPAAVDVIESGSRIGKSGGVLQNLNVYYTRLSGRFTECRFPAQPRLFSTAGQGESGAFRTIDRFSIGPLTFDVLESRGGHTPGLVFFLERTEGLLFTSDFLINVPSLLPDEKEHLGLYRALLTSPNRDNRLYKEETEALKALALELDGELKQRGKAMLVFPGHGEYYRAEVLGTKR